MTPAAEEWFYFKLQFRPGWCLYNRETGDFTGENNLLEVYATEGEGTSESEWTRVWSLKDYILANYTTADLVTDMTSYDHNGYEPIFVNVSQYLGKEIKLAFRFFGVNGQGMALDDVALGIPMPKPSYTLPSGFFKQQSLTPTMDEIDGDYRLLIPFGAEATWTNTSEDILTSEWTYATADGSSATSEAKHLTTPAYALGQNYAAPVLTAVLRAALPTIRHLIRLCRPAVASTVKVNMATKAPSAWLTMITLTPQAHSQSALLQSVFTPTPTTSGKCFSAVFPKPLMCSAWVASILPQMFPTASTM